MRVERLDPSRHKRKTFDCGNAELSEWLANYARQADESGSARTFILTEDGETIVGFYSLTSHAVDVDAVSAALAKGLPKRFPIPSVLLSRLAIDVQYQNAGLGERLLADPVRRVAAVGEDVGIALLVVDAKHDQAAGYYKRFGFERWPADGLRLFARVKDITATIEG